YYQSDAHTNTVELTFEVLNPTDWVDLVVKHGLPLPNLNNFEQPNGIGSSLDPNQPGLPATSNIKIKYTRDNYPRDLNGRWYLGVANLTNNPSIDYTIKVT